MIIKSLLSFIQTRFSLTLSLPLTAILVLSSSDLTRIYFMPLATSLATIFLALLLVRAVDDISSIEEDRTKVPPRGLVCGAIDPAWLSWDLFFLYLLTLSLNYASKPTLIFLASITLFYATFFVVKKRLSAVPRAFFGNLIFFVAPFLVKMVSGDAIDVDSVARALFIYFSVVAHDFSHEMTPPLLEAGEGIPSYTNQRKMVKIASGLYFLGGLAALWLSFLNGGFHVKAGLFHLALMVVALVIGYRLQKLYVHPIELHATPFYIWGFLFFLLPLLGSILDQILVLMLF